MKHLDPKALWLLFFQSFVSLALTMIILFGWLGPLFMTITSPYPGNEFTINSLFPAEGIAAMLIALSCVGLFAYLWANLVYNNYRYELGDIGFKKEEGVIMKHYVTIPYDRIQNVDIHRGIIARILGLSDLKIQTAGFSATGAASSEGRLMGLSQTDAEALRDELIVRAKTSRSQGI